MNKTQSRTKLLFGLTYLIIWGFSIVFYWVIMSPSDVMGYTLIFVYVLNPASILAISLLIGIRGTRRKEVWAALVMFGITYMLLPYFTFSLGNTMFSGNVHAPEIKMGLIGTGVSAIGLGLGSFIGSLAKKRRVENEIDSHGLFTRTD